MAELHCHMLIFYGSGIVYVQSSCNNHALIWCMFCSIQNLPTSSYHGLCIFAWYIHLRPNVLLYKQLATTCHWDSAFIIMKYYHGLIVHIFYYLSLYKEKLYQQISSLWSRIICTLPVISWDHVFQFPTGPGPVYQLQVSLRLLNSINPLVVGLSTWYEIQLAID